MKNLFVLLSFLIFFGCQDNHQKLADNSSKKFLEITANLTLEEFEVVKNFILQKGNRQTWSNMYNNNPHFSFEGFEVYLNPEIGQKNINCDPEISDFNELVIRDKNIDPQYFHVLVVRQGDLQNEEIFYTVPEGMKEKKVYLLNPYGNDLEKMNANLQEILKKIKEVISAVAEN